MNDTSQHILRITSHPTTDGALLIHAHPDLAAFMGRYPYARWSPDDKAFLLHAEALPGLQRHADRDHIVIVDQRTPATTDTSPDPRGRPVPQECRHCAQPGSWSRPPTRCPACGQPWNPVPPPTDPVTERRSWNTCPNCGHRQAAHWAYCSECGHPMPEPAPAITRPAITAGTRRESRNANPVTREHLDEPLPLAATIDETLDHVTDQAAPATPVETPQTQSHKQATQLADPVGITQDLES